ncbi:MAG TPA: TIGR00153 family protein [Longimicrobiaceae bacterium]|nr:TIGR00153 family protein [Longimicrobiaceae bacterium]
MRSIFGLFAKSPFGSLLQHTEKVHETATQLRPLMEAFLAGDFELSTEITKRIYKLEHQADLIKDGIRSTMPRSLMLPVDRGDLLRFLHEQDSIADAVEDVGDLLTMRRTPTPEGFRDVVLELVDRVIRTSETWYAAAAEITRLQEVGFSGVQANKVLELVARVNQEEWEADKQEARVLKALFGFEDELGAVSVVVWMNIIQTVGEVADHAENSAELLRLMLARA